MDQLISMADLAFRKSLSEFATGVAVITAQGQGEDLIGMTMSSFNSVSIDPPLVLFSVDRTAHSLPAMLDAKGYAVNVLAREQENISNRFARALSDKWAEVRCTVGHAEAPLITGALAHFECEPYASYDGGDHVIFVVRVLRHSVRAGNPAPLIFFRGRYRDLVDESEREPTWPLPMHY
jgi:flavin reductase (DIM6/NTAB) family NADH-FMN oxidoreductase RutF